MQREHLTYEDLEQYLNATDLSETYLCWAEHVMGHLDECEQCQKQMQQMLLISSVCDQDNLESGLFALEKEEDIRRKWSFLRMEMQKQETTGCNRNDNTTRQDY